jgi:hypothetical protein
MTKKSLILMVCILVSTLVMYKCKNKDADPLTPDQGLVEEINKIEVEKVKLEEPEAVKVTESKIEASPEVVALGKDAANMATTGVEPASLKASATEFSSFFTKDEIAALAGVKKEVVESAAKGEKLPANLQAIMTKAAGNAAFAAYFPKVTFPTVEGKEIKGARIGKASSARISGVDATQASDACLATAEAEFEKVKTKLDASHTEQLAAADAKYDSDVKLASASQISCTDNLFTKYAGLILAAETLAGQLTAILDANAAVLGSDYLPLKAIVSLQLIAYLEELIDLEKADLKWCTEQKAAGTLSAENARDNNKESIETAYASALEILDKAKQELIKSCHNQGGGN